jgi:DNA-binding transcriptional ArsR family regulator
MQINWHRDNFKYSMRRNCFALWPCICDHRLNRLRDHEQNVGELAEHCACSQANVSKHLSTLSKHGLVAREGRGTSVYHRIADPAIYALCDLVCGNVARQLET